MNNNLVNRTLASFISDVFRVLPVITLTGPRQSGKTTLCREQFPNLPYVSLEDADTLAEVQTDPKAFFNRHPKGVIIDEAHHFPNVFSYIQVIVDEDRFHGTDQHHYIVTGSSNFTMMAKITQSMAGRTAVFSLLPLSTSEILSYQPKASTSKMLLAGIPDLHPPMCQSCRAGVQCLSRIKRGGGCRKHHPKLAQYPCCLLRGLSVASLLHEHRQTADKDSETLLL